MQYRADVPESGWYADPEDASRLRLWDGDAWTDVTAGSDAEAVAPARPVRCREGRSPLVGVVTSDRVPAPGPTSLRSARGRLVVRGGGAVAVLAIGTAIFLARSNGHPKVQPVPHADRIYLAAVRRDLPAETAPDSNVLLFGRIVCGTYEKGLSGSDRARQVDRPDLIPEPANRTRIFGEALNHLCPQYQLAGIAPNPARPGETLLQAPAPNTATTTSAPTVSVVTP